MLAIILTEDQHKYLTHVFQQFCGVGLDPSELGIAASVWGALASAKLFEMPETHTINADVKVELNGDMHMPLPVDPA